MFVQWKCSLSKEITMGYVTPWNVAIRPRCQDPIDDHDRDRSFWLHHRLPTLDLFVGANPS